jgi:hypothetical protein
MSYHFGCILVREEDSTSCPKLDLRIVERSLFLLLCNTYLYSVPLDCTACDSLPITCRQTMR